MLGVHASASAIIQYGKIARKQGLVNVALDILSRIHTIPTVPIVDCFQKIRQQVKCYLQLAGVMGKNECMQVGQLHPWSCGWNSGITGAVRYIDLSKLPVSRAGARFPWPCCTLQGVLF